MLLVLNRNRMLRSELVPSHGVVMLAHGLVHHPCHQLEEELSFKRVHGQPMDEEVLLGKLGMSEGRAYDRRLTLGSSRPIQDHSLRIGLLGLKVSQEAQAVVQKAALK